MEKKYNFLSKIIQTRSQWNGNFKRWGNQSPLLKILNSAKISAGKEGENEFLLKQKLRECVTNIPVLKEMKLRFAQETSCRNSYIKANIFLYPFQDI